MNNFEKEILNDLLNYTRKYANTMNEIAEIDDEEEQDKLINSVNRQYIVDVLIKMATYKLAKESGEE